MKVRVVKKCVRRLSDDEYSQCRQYNFGTNGKMQEDLDFARGEPGNKSKAIMIKRGEEILAWALVQFDFEAEGANVYFWTRPEYRRKGLGQRLIEAVYRMDDKPYVFPHDSQSAAFFKNHIGKIRCAKADEFWLVTT